MQIPWQYFSSDSTGQQETNFTDDKNIIRYFTEGQCNALAWELHKLKGWSLGLVSDLPVGNADYMGHCFVYNSDGLVVDIRGVQHFNTFMQDWDFLSCVHRFTSTEEYEQEMVLWENTTHYTKDRKAKQWARIIVDKLNS